MADKNPMTSNISPPTDLPSFILQQQSPKKEGNTFSPAIPSEKNITAEPPKPTAQKKPEEEIPTEEQHDELPSMQDIAQALSPITEGVKNSVLFGWVKDTVKSGISSGVQRAKECADKVVTTLDPQMSQLICK